MLIHLSIIYKKEKHKEIITQQPKTFETNIVDCWFKHSELNKHCQYKISYYRASKNFT